MKLLYMMLACMLPLTAQALPSEASRYVPEAKAVGEGTLSVMFWDAYQATLYAPNGRYEQSAPVALKLTYLMDFEGSDIADRSAKEIRNLGYQDELKIAAWHREMERLFPDVEKGQSITGVRTKEGKAIFFFGEQRLGMIESDGFADAFFGIWLNEKTSAPELRQKLLSAR